MTGPAQPEVEVGAMDEAVSQTEEEANVVDAQSWSWDARSATGQGSSRRSWSWYGHSATGQDERWDERHQQSWSSNDWGAGASGATEDGQRLRRPEALPQGDSRLTEHRRNMRTCVCDACGITVPFARRTMEFDGRFVDESWRAPCPLSNCMTRGKRAILARHGGAPCVTTREVPEVVQTSMRRAGSLASRGVPTLGRRALRLGAQAVTDTTWPR